MALRPAARSPHPGAVECVSRTSAKRSRGIRVRPLWPPPGDHLASVSASSSNPSRVEEPCMSVYPLPKSELFSGTRCGFTGSPRNRAPLQREIRGTAADLFTNSLSTGIISGA
jgi:hypothetical protein